MLGIGRNYFENIRNHLLNNGLLSRLHGNTKKDAQVKNQDGDKDVATAVKNFLLNYAQSETLIA